MAFRNKNIVIIGGSSGIGFATAQLAYQQGATVTITGTSTATAQQAAQLIGNVAAYPLDITDEHAVNRFFNQLTAIDHVLVSAGGTKLGSLFEGSVADHATPIQLRLLGNIHVVRAATPKLRSGGSFTFTGGLSTDRPVSGAWVSGIATAVAEQMARVLALDLAPIRFNAISPGYTDTPMWTNVLGDNREQVLATVAHTLPVKRIARPDEVAQAVLSLMQNKSVTGEVIHVDGGARLV
ncbi:SDR family oxidoreductase [Spirosoma endbachense]|uniref:SDR family oxidoreductase n=1 Tax=Spirosoma endbachense TaxID=2666025 RepID=A0A6P1W7N9_9BACT|nr:SDR family oxidoreductase [Spirosoma endbachense]QHW00393.1 SDR family oxidoreductase [Spirosoma endbachense]